MCKRHSNTEVFNYHDYLSKQNLHRPFYPVCRHIVYAVIPSMSQLISWQCWLGWIYSALYACQVYTLRRSYWGSSRAGMIGLVWHHVFYAGDNSVRSTELPVQCVHTCLSLQLASRISYVFKTFLLRMYSSCKVCPVDRSGYGLAAISYSRNKQQWVIQETYKTIVTVWAPFSCLLRSTSA